METNDKRSLGERDICSRFVTPALVAAGWNLQSQIREEVTFTAERVIVRGQQVTRGELAKALESAEKG
jgi:type I restriction enzyme R subunit